MAKVFPEIASAALVAVFIFLRLFPGRFSLSSFDAGPVTSLEAS
jgi:hypothetical protein